MIQVLVAGSFPALLLYNITLILGAAQDDDDEAYSDDDSQRGYASDNQFSSDEECSSENGDAMARIRGVAGRHHDDADDNKSRFSQYSMSSSVMRRNNGLTLLDDKFEKVSK